MKQSIGQLILMLLVCFWGGARPLLAVEVHSRPSLKGLVQRIKLGPEISKTYRGVLETAGTPEKGQLKKLVSPNSQLLSEFRNLSLEKVSFARGEIESEEVLNGMMTLLQLSLLQMRQWSGAPLKNSLSKLKEEARVWFEFAAELAYNEASLVGMKTAGVIRSLVLDELEFVQRKRAKELAQDIQWLRWIQGNRTPWPVDRMLLSEARRFLSSPSLAVMEKAAMKIQKNPYLSVEVALSQVPGGKPSELDKMKVFWAEKDMDGLKTEATRIQILVLSAASLYFETQQGRAATAVSELVDKKILASGPIDYHTGKPLDLAQVIKSEK